MTNKQRSTKIFEYTWLVIAVISGLSAIHASKNHGFNKDFLVFSSIVLLSILMYRLRRNKRKLQ